MNTTTTVTRSMICSGNYRYSTRHGSMAVTGSSGCGWTIAQWTPATGTVYLGTFNTLTEADQHIREVYA